MLKTVTRQRRDCDLNPGPTAPESSTLTTRLPSQRRALSSKPVGRRFCRRSVEQTERRMDRCTDGQTDARSLHRPCCTYYAGSVSNRSLRSVSFVDSALFGDSKDGRPENTTFQPLITTVSLSIAELYTGSLSSQARSQKLNNEKAIRSHFHPFLFSSSPPFPPFPLEVEPFPRLRQGSP